MGRALRAVPRAVRRRRGAHSPPARSRALRAAQGHEFLRPLQAARRRQHRRADQRSPVRPRRRQQGQARRRVSQHRLQQRRQPGPHQRPQPPSPAPARRLPQARARPAPQPRVRRRDRQHLHLLDRALRHRRRQEGGRVLHAARRLRAGRTARGAQAGRHDLRPGLRLCRPAHRGGARRRCSRQLRPVRHGGQRQHLGAGAHEHVPAQRRQRRHRVGRHAQQPDACRGRPAQALRRGGRQPAVLARQVGRRRRSPRPLQPLLARRAAQEQGRLGLHHPHGRGGDEREGRVAVVVPHGVLFRGAAERRIRQH